MPIRVDIDKIEEARKRRGWRKQDLARRSGITPPRLSQIYQDSLAGKFPTPHRLKEIAEVLGLKIEDVVIVEEAARTQEQGQQASGQDPKPVPDNGSMEWNQQEDRE